MMITTSNLYPRRKMLFYLEELKSKADITNSIYIPSGSSSTDIQEVLKLISRSNEIEEFIIREIESTDTGAVFFFSEVDRYLIIPPFPIHDRASFNGYNIEPLKQLLEQEFLVALLLVRLGSYAVGVFKGEELISSKVGTGNIHSRHRQGGSSQRRFERGREKQIEYFFGRLCNRARENIEPYVNNLDFVVYGGERHTILNFKKQCHFMQQLDDRVLLRVLNVRHPKMATLSEAMRNVWSCRLIRW